MTTREHQGSMLGGAMTATFPRRRATVAGEPHRSRVTRAVTRTWASALSLTLLRQSR